MRYAASGTREVTAELLSASHQQNRQCYVLATASHCCCPRSKASISFRMLPSVQSCPAFFQMLNRSLDLCGLFIEKWQVVLSIDGLTALQSSRGERYAPPTLEMVSPSDIRAGQPRTGQQEPGLSICRASLLRSGSVVNGVAIIPIATFWTALERMGFARTQRGL
jgi:hypothetical protein